MRGARLRLLCSIGVLLSAGASGEEPAPPNIVMILVDDLGYGDLSSLGARDIETPRIDSLATEGVRFDRFYANSTVCSPTRAALLTGRYPDLVGVPGVIRTHAEDSWGRLAGEAVLLPRVLKARGYHTAIIGKWHLGLAPPDTPLDRGFDVFRGFLGDMMDDYTTHRRHGVNYMRDGREEVDPEGHATELFTRWAIEHIAARGKDPAPFFLYLAYNAPHSPIQPPPAWLERARRRLPGAPEGRLELVALIEHLDDQIGKVLDALRESGLEERTLVLFASDNGGDLRAGATSGVLRGGKQDLYEGGIRSPLHARWPGHIRAGSRCDALGLTMDIFPTICEAAGAAIEHPIDGRSLLPELLGSEREHPVRTVVWCRREGGPRYQGQDYHAIARGRWKLLHNSPFAPYELYDLEADPGETRNLATERKDILDDLSRALRAHIQRAGAVPWQAPRTEP